MPMQCQAIQEFCYSTPPQNCYDYFHLVAIIVDFTDTFTLQYIFLRTYAHVFTSTSIMEFLRLQKLKHQPINPILNNPVGGLHYNDVITSTMSSQITSLTIVYSTVRSKNISKLCVTGLCAGNSPVTGEFPAQRASNAENVSIWWRHHVAEFTSLRWYCVPQTSLFNDQTTRTNAIKAMSPFGNTGSAVPSREAWRWLG